MAENRVGQLLHRVERAERRVIVDERDERGTRRDEASLEACRLSVAHPVERLSRCKYTGVPVRARRRVRERQRLEALLRLWRDGRLLDRITRSYVDAPGGPELVREEHAVESPKDAVLVARLTSQASH